MVSSAVCLVSFPSFFVSPVLCQMLSMLAFICGFNCVVPSRPLVMSFWYAGSGMAVLELHMDPIGVVAAFDVWMWVHSRLGYYFWVSNGLRIFFQNFTYLV